MGQQVINAFRDDDTFFQPVRQLAAGVIADFQTELAKTNKSLVTWARTFDKALAEDAAKIVRQIAASTHRVPRVRIPRETTEFLDALEAYLYDGNETLFGRM